MDEEDKQSLREFYFPKDVENLGAETETGSRFCYQKPNNK